MFVEGEGVKKILEEPTWGGGNNFYSPKTSHKKFGGSFRLILRVKKPSIEVVGEGGKAR